MLRKTPEKRPISAVHFARMARIGRNAFLVRVKNTDGICPDPIRMMRNSERTYIKNDLKRNCKILPIHKMRTSETQPLHRIRKVAGSNHGR
jgi:hypothetical protein